MKTESRKWFVHYMKKSLGQRKGRVVVAILSVMIASGMVVTGTGLSAGIEKKLGGELKAYGANIMITPSGGEWLDSSDLDALSTVDGIDSSTGQLYGRATVGEGGGVEMIGLDMASIKGWRITGLWPLNDGEALAGVNVKNALELEPGESLELGFGHTKSTLKITGFVERGGAEDASVIMSLGGLQRLLGLEGKLSAILVRGAPERLDGVVAALRDRFPGAQIKTLKQVASAEVEFLRKIKLLMLLVSLVVIPASAISVASTMSATVLERMKEIGLMKAIGGTRREIGTFYLAEAACIGIAGGVLGYLAGLASSQAVSRGAFGSFIDMPFYLVPVSVGIGLLIAIISSAVPLRGALRYRPSVILRGE